MVKPTLHVIGFPHTETTSNYLHCAYTQKIVKFCKMMSAMEYPVILYAGEKNEAICKEHVAILTKVEREKYYGRWDPNGLFGNVDWNPHCEPWSLFNQRCNTEIRKRCMPKDILCLTMGHSQHTIADAFPECIPVEWAIGYEGIHFQNKVFESYAWMHHVYGLRGIKDGSSTDTVIPNFFDENDFNTETYKHLSREDYILFIGRIVRRKGPHIAAEIAKRCKKKLYIAGPGAIEVRPGYIKSHEIEIIGDHVEYVGCASKHVREFLMKRAKCVIVPTQYIEPFGGVAIEAMMCGTPVVTTDWGAFTETVKPGISGERFGTMNEGVKAVEMVSELPSTVIRQYALDHYSFPVIGRKFDKYFERVSYDQS